MIAQQQPIRLVRGGSLPHKNVNPRAGARPALNRCPHCGQFCRHGCWHRARTGDLFAHAAQVETIRAAADNNVRSLFTARVLPVERAAGAVAMVGCA